MTDTKAMMIALKVLGIYCLIVAAQYFPVMFYSLAIWSAESPFRGNALFWGTLPCVISLTAAFILICYTENLARKLFPSGEALSAPAQDSGANLYALVLPLVGVILIVWAVPKSLSQLIGIVFFCFSVPTTDGVARFEQFGREIWVSAIQTLLYVVLGLYLIFGVKRIAGFLRKHKGI